MMFFYYARSNGKWTPQTRSSQPHRVSKDMKGFFTPWTDKGLGRELDAHEETLSLDELSALYPPPVDEPPATLQEEEQLYTENDVIEAFGIIASDNTNTTSNKGWK